MTPAERATLLSHEAFVHAAQADAHELRVGVGVFFGALLVLLFCWWLASIFDQGH